MAKKIAVSDTTLSDNKCDICYESKCCRYVTQNIDKPTSMRDFDLLLWQISHKNVHIFKDSEGWYLLFLSECLHLLDDGRCGIYEKRPLICRDHSNDYCEFDVSIEEGSDLYFGSYEALDKYCRKRYKGWDKRFKKKSWQQNA
ncbi:YkgJ family cysteine cluster protein [Ketobacter sp. MCCC 1A13808]|uniref:YkgJ family cysteine cluster protein n=1 Tax=Ketobacter sp. MCCC 1A13808 TaxID=2602738 RepID=UPI0012EB7FF4|nr:YkgJ family cysteine cluster protein [Ketobacter sp. MCCC 1A13808]MVF14611.1 YkgJ family cysteine cluster protein [Ketobacter sp. MCCC 1A13808]